MAGFVDMNNIKKLLMILIVVALITGIIAVPTFAAQSLKYEDEARVLNQLGLFKGVSATEYRPNLEAKLLREEAVALLLRMFGLEEEALKMSEREATNVLKRFKDADEIATWAIKYIAYAVENNVIVGGPDGNFAPKGNLLGREYSKMILAILGYVQEIDFQYAFSTFEFCNITGFSKSEAAKLDTQYILRDDAVGMS
ncbi:MAG: S-layer homology domain-containing protein, partial [Firmicutes bacterium]|nr:S-layer homology domain-containing protein [Bacillota bacterium]